MLFGQHEKYREVVASFLKKPMKKDPGVPNEKETAYFYHS